jgi:hypothetical protein
MAAVRDSLGIGIGMCKLRPSDAEILAIEVMPLQMLKSPKWQSFEIGYDLQFGSRYVNDVKLLL